MGNTISIRVSVAFLVVLLAVGCASTGGVRDEVMAEPLQSMRITSGFGQRNGRPHYGIDMPAPRGTPVQASASGRVVFAGRQRGFGKVVIIKHANGIETYYAHLSSIKTRKDHRVGQGDVIGKVGKTGNATGPHLHFEVRKDARPIDPRAALGQSPYSL